MVECPICGKPVQQARINEHIDSGCAAHLGGGGGDAAPPLLPSPAHSQTQTHTQAGFSSFFQKPAAGPAKSFDGGTSSSTAAGKDDASPAAPATPAPTKRPADDTDAAASPPATKRSKAEHHIASAAPLAERMRPRTLDDVHGQTLVAPHGALRALLESDRLPSLILWGGPGTGKTTIARLLARATGARFVEINSASSGVAECKRLFADARGELGVTGRRTVVFCDEMHRFSKAQQDVFLAPVEAGAVTLVAATTENPSFRLINALLSRCRVFALAPLDEAAVSAILARALATLHPDGSAPAPPALIDAELTAYIARAAAGDARTALNLLELALALARRAPPPSPTDLRAALTTSLLHDRAGDLHYDLISALHKSIRGSAPSAALYYLARMLAAGEDPLYVARRLVVVASEDVGLADNSLLPLAVAAQQATAALGMPEARIPLAHCVAALALAPKSVRAYRGFSRAEAAAREPGAGARAVPVHLRNAPTRLLREMGVGREYKYNPDFEGGRVRQEYMPAGMEGREFLGEMDLGTEVDKDLEEEGGGGGGGGGGVVMGDGGGVDAVAELDKAMAHGSPGLKGDGADEAADVGEEGRIELDEWEA